MTNPLTRASRCWPLTMVIVLAGLVGCDSGGRLGDDCSSDSDCDTSDYRCVKCSIRSTCYFDGFTDVDDDVYACSEYGKGTALRAGGGSSTTGACAYFHSKLGRILCEQKSASGCTGKFFGNGASCAGLSCSTNSPSSCTVSGGGGSSGSCVGTNEICNSNTVSGCTITFCAGGAGGCYYVANGKRFSCNGGDVSTCGVEAGKYCSGG